MTTTKKELLDIAKSANLGSYILIACCFILWGFTNDITGVMASAFSRIFQLSTTEASSINIANATGYLLFAIPAAMFMLKYTFKSGVMFSLGIYAIGILLMIPAKQIGVFPAFLVAYFVMTCGSAALETCCHPLIYNMGREESGIFRLNLAQALNSLGAVIGMYVAMNYIQNGFSRMTEEQRLVLPRIQADIIKEHDLDILVSPYLYLSAVIILLLVLIRLTKMPAANDSQSDKGLFETFRKLLKINNYRQGVIAEFFYIGAQVCCLTFIIVYTRQVLTAEGIFEGDIDKQVNKYSMLAIVLYAVMRFICTSVLLYVKPGRLLSVMGIVATTALLGAIVFTDRNGIYCIIIACAAMSMMFPTIYGIALRGLGTNTKYASAGLTMTVFAGAVFPTLQAAIIDMDITLWGLLPAVNVSFIVPLICFAVVALYGNKGYIRHNITHDYAS